MESEEGIIQYEVGLKIDDSLQELWNSYTSENKEKYFRLFLNGFVTKWEQKVRSWYNKFYFKTVERFLSFQQLVEHCKEMKV